MRLPSCARYPLSGEGLLPARLVQCPHSPLARLPVKHRCPFKQPVFIWTDLDKVGSPNPDPAVRLPELQCPVLALKPAVRPLKATAGMDVPTRLWILLERFPQVEDVDMSVFRHLVIV